MSWRESTAMITPYMKFNQNLRGRVLFQDFFGRSVVERPSFNIRLFSSVVTVGVRPVGLRFKLIPSSRNVLIIRAMKFCDNAWESSSCSPVQAELATKFYALVPQQFHRMTASTQNSICWTVHMVGWHKVTSKQNKKWCIGELMLLW